MRRAGARRQPPEELANSSARGRPAHVGEDPENNTMPTAEAHVQADRPSRYLVQLCRHAQQVHRLRHQPRIDGGDAQAPPEIRADQVHVEWSDTDGIVTLPWGRCLVRANGDVLTLRVEAANEDNLRQVQDIVTRNIERFGRRDRLKVTWQRTQPPGSAPPDLQPADPHAPERTAAAMPRRRQRGTKALAMVGALGIALTVAVHLGLGGLMVTASRWLDWTAIGLMAVPVVVLLGHAAVPITVLRLRRRAARRN